MSEREGWRDDAACAGKHHLFYAPDGRAGRPHHAEYGDEAKKVCGACPVIRDCFAYVLELERRTKFICGIWAGMTEQERSAQYERLFAKGKHRLKIARAEED